MQVPLTCSTTLHSLRKGIKLSSWKRTRFPHISGSIFHAFIDAYDALHAGGFFDLVPGDVMRLRSCAIILIVCVCVTNEIKLHINSGFLVLLRKNLTQRQCTRNSNLASKPAPIEITRPIAVTLDTSVERLIEQWSFTGSKINTIIWCCFRVNDHSVTLETL